MKTTVFNLLFVLVCYCSADAQSNIILESGKGGAIPSVAISLKNNDNIAVIVADRAYTSQDGGKTWNENILKAPAYQVISDQKGDFYAFHDNQFTKNGTKSICSVSDDEGESWSADGSVDFNYGGMGLAAADLNGSAIYRTWISFDDKNGVCKILINDSNNGKKWGTPDRIRQLSEDCRTNSRFGACPAVGPQGQLYVAWADDQKIWLDRSLNKGKFWLTSDIEVNTMPARGDQYRSTPVLVSDNSESRYRGILYLSWASPDQTNNSNILFQLSANHGDTWTSPEKVNEEKPGTTCFSSWMTMDNTTGDLYVVYYQKDTNTGKTDVYLAFSEDRGSSFTRRKISTTSFTTDKQPLLGTYVSANEGRIVPVWVRMDDGEYSVVTTVIEQEELIIDN